MRADIELAQFLDEVGGVITPVGTQRDRAGPVGMALDHLQRRQSFGMARDAGKPGIDDQARAVLHQAMADEARLRFHARPLLVEHGVGIGAADMCRVQALLAPEIGGALRPPASPPSSRSSLGRKLFTLAQTSTSIPSTLK